MISHTYKRSFPIIKAGEVHGHQPVLDANSVLIHYCNWCRFRPVACSFWLLGDSLNDGWFLVLTCFYLGVESRRYQSWGAILWLASLQYLCICAFVSEELACSLQCLKHPSTSCRSPPTISPLLCKKFGLCSGLTWSKLQLIFGKKWKEIKSNKMKP